VQSLDVQSTISTDDSIDQLMPSPITWILAVVLLVAVALVAVGAGLLFYISRTKRFTDLN
jgi:hypothetical protein